jgi:hypothetical protein
VVIPFAVDLCPSEATVVKQTILPHLASRLTNFTHSDASFITTAAGSSERIKDGA